MRVHASRATVVAGACVVCVLTANVARAEPEASLFGADPITVEAPVLAKQQQISTLQAEADLRIQSEAGNIAGELAKRLGQGYAGVWFDLKTGGFHVGVASGTNRAVASSVVAEAGVSEWTMFDPVRHTWAEVESAASSLASQLSPLESLQKAAVLTDPRVNGPVVELADDVSGPQRERVEKAAVATALPPKLVTIPAGRLKIQSDVCSFPWCDPALKGGIGIVSTTDPRTGLAAFCTAGAKATEAHGFSYEITAGHCVEGDTYYKAPYAWRTYNSKGQQCTMGPPVAGELSTRMDAVVLGAPGGCGSIVGQLIDWGALIENYPVHGVVTAYPGLYECHQGATTRQGCGDVEAANVATSINYTEEGRGVITVEHTDRVCTSPPARKGDSGGPWQYGTLEWTYLTAIVLGSNEVECGAGGFAVGYELSYVEAFIGVSVTRQF